MCTEAAAPQHCTFRWIVKSLTHLSEVKGAFKDDKTSNPLSHSPIIRCVPMRIDHACIVVV